MFKFLKKCWNSLALILGNLILLSLVAGVISSIYFVINDKNYN